MQENLPPPECIDFPVLIDQLAKRLSIGDQEKLGAFVRGMVVAVLEAVEIKTRKKFSVDRVEFSLPDSNGNLGIVKLDLVERKEGDTLPKGICSVSIKGSEYRGMPDGVKMGNDPTQTVSMVGRKRINVMNFRPTTLNTWFSLVQIVKSRRPAMAHLLQLDIQINP